ncbi:MAG: hypothetical protein JWN99_209 [Ilumatobacteraceae bacterium]|nr:hypothetical protein [Ilumatobacteraceae bacterium]
MRRLRAVIAVAALWAMTACGGGLSRAEARSDLVDQLVSGGIDRTVAECVVEQFFDARSDDELKAFFDREELTDAERAEFARLTKGCTPD